MSDNLPGPSAESQSPERRTTYLTLLDEISALVISATPGHGTLSEALARIRSSLHLDLVALYVGQPLTFSLAVGGNAGQPGLRVPEGLAVQAAQNQRPILSRDAGEGPSFSRLPWVPEGTEAEAAFPIRYQDRPIGALDLFGSDLSAFDAMDLRAMSALSRLLGIAIVQDRWEEREATFHDLRQAYRRLQGFAELKDQILQNISHELRTPLTLIKGYLELMCDNQMGPLVPEQRRSLDIVVRKVDDVVAIVEQTLSLRPFDGLALEAERVSVKSLLEEMVVAFEGKTTGSPVTLDLKPVADELYLRGDVEKLRQLCYNILDNAVKFSPEGGRVTISAGPEEEYVHLAFKDQGIGIPERQLSQIFETFYQVDGSSTRRFGGLGLGLAVVNRVVEAHQGKVWAESELNKGSTFHVLLPRDTS